MRELDTLHELVVISITAVVGVFFYKLAMSVLPDNIVTKPFKQVAAFL